MQRQTSIGPLTLVVGHGLGVIGAIFAMDAVATAINPHFLSLFPFQAGGIQQDSAGVIGIVMMAMATWLVWARDYRRRKTLAALSKRDLDRDPRDDR